MNNIGKSLTRLTKKKNEKAQILRIKEEMSLQISPTLNE